MAPGSIRVLLSGRNMNNTRAARPTRISDDAPVEADVVRRQVVVELLVDEGTERWNAHAHGK